MFIGERHSDYTRLQTSRSWPKKQGESTSSALDLLGGGGGMVRAQGATHSSFKNIYIYILHKTKKVDEMHIIMNIGLQDITPLRFFLKKRSVRLSIVSVGYLGGDPAG